MIYIINNALHISGVFRPSSGAYKLYDQPTKKIVSNNPFVLRHLRNLYYTPTLNTPFYRPTNTAQNQQGAEIHNI